jgi:hypothetical protein
MQPTLRRTLTRMALCAAIATLASGCATRFDESGNRYYGTFPNLGSIGYDDRLPRASPNPIESNPWFDSMQSTASFLRPKQLW